MNIPLYHTFMENEAALISGCKEGNGAAQKTLYNQYAETLMIICLRYAGSKEDAKDMLMLALAECFKSINNFDYRGEGSLKAWLKGVTVNQCLMQLRKQRIRFEEWDGRQEEGSEIQDNDVLALLSVKEMMLLIHELPPGYRTVFNLYVFEDMSHKEIAASLGIAESTSKSQLHKARVLLQNKINRSQNIAL